MIISAITTGLIAVIGGAAFLVGTGISYFLWQGLLGAKRRNIISDAENEAEVIKKEKNTSGKRKIPAA